MKLRKKTETFRATVTGTGGVVIGPEKDAPSKAVRRVTVTTPEDTAVALQVDATPADIAGARDYHWPWPPRGRVLDFHLWPEQHIAAVVRTPSQGDGGAHFLVSVEYLAD